MEHALNVPNSPTCSVVVPTSNRPSQLEQCLTALRRGAGGQDLDIVIVDSAPRDDAARDVAYRTNCRYFLSRERGASRARNLGARSCTNEVVAFTDDDAIPDPEWCRWIIAEFGDERVMAATGAVRPPEGISDESGITHASRMGISYSGGDHSIVVRKSDSQWLEIAAFGGIGIGPNMAIRRRLFDSWGGFDERVGPGTRILGGEEPFAFVDILEMGHAIAYTPRAVVRHPSPLPSEAQLDRREKDLMTAASAMMILLFMERPAHRRRLLRYVVEGIGGRARPWRATPPVSLTPLSRGTRLICFFKGFELALRLPSRAAPKVT